VLAGLVLVAAVVAGELAPSGGPVVGTITTALVQGGGKRGLRAIEVNPMIPYHAQLAASAAIRPGSVQLVVWPEDVVGLSRPLAGSPEERQLADLARHLHATLIAGVTQPKGRHHFLNYVEAWSPTGKEIGRYEKVHRVPFGEYVPMRWLFKHLANLSDVPRNAIPGKKPGFLRTPAGPLGIMISYETFFPHRGRVAVQAGGQVLLVPTNDASYRGAQMPTMEVAASELRAIEEGRNLVQVAPTGYTAVITNRGRLLVRSVLGQRSVIETTLPERRGRTVFNEIGSDPVIGLGLVLLVAAWAAEWSSRRRRAIGAQA
jgi:apolipoprotein N-acyltransferase